MTRDDSRHENDVDDRYNVVEMVARPLYFGLGVNVLAPASLLMVCYWVANHYHVGDSIPQYADIVFYVFVALSLGQAAYALMWRGRAFKEPLCRRKETIEQDVKHGILTRSRRVFLLIASISIWGFIFFPLTGRFQETALFVVFSFVVFQVVRPRYGFVRKLLLYQEDLVEQGKLADEPSVR